MERGEERKERTYGFRSTILFFYGEGKGKPHLGLLWAPIVKIDMEKHVER